MVQRKQKREGKPNWWYYLFVIERPRTCHSKLSPGFAFIHGNTPLHEMAAVVQQFEWNPRWNYPKRLLFALVGVAEIGGQVHVPVWAHKDCYPGLSEMDHLSDRFALSMWSTYSAVLQWAQGAQLPKDPGMFNGGRSQCLVWLCERLLQKRTMINQDAMSTGSTGLMRIGSPPRSQSCQTFEINAEFLFPGLQQIEYQFVKLKVATVTDGVSLPFVNDEVGQVTEVCHYTLSSLQECHLSVAPTVMRSLIKSGYVMVHGHHQQCENNMHKDRDTWWRLGDQTRREKWWRGTRDFTGSIASSELVLLSFTGSCKCFSKSLSELATT